MLRSFDYASRSVLTEREKYELERLEDKALNWDRHNREAFLVGYRATDGVDHLLPSDAKSHDVLMAAFELDKALYELNYELAYRPDWADIPRTAIARLTSG
jgi:predicted trehalose synthase